MEAESPVLRNPFRPEGFDFSDQSALKGSRCADCGECFFPPRGACLRCGGTRMEPVDLSTTGKIHSYTIIRRAPAGFEPPYGCGWVHLPEGTLLWSILKGPVDKLKVGSDVELVFDKFGGRTAYFFRLAG